MKAWENELKRRKNATPSISYQENWEKMQESNIFPNDLLLTFWQSNVPGSNAPESMIVGAVQSVENMGRDVSKAEILLEQGFHYLSSDDFIALKALTSEIFYLLDNSPIIENHRFHHYLRPLKWEEISKFFPTNKFNLSNKIDIKDKIHGGWLGQLAGGSMGTKFEGYTHNALEKVFGEQLGKYVGEVSTLNDDVTYEIIFLKTCEEKKKDISSMDVAKNWISYIPFGWSAELMALDNIKRGIFPPDSGYFYNPFQEWIGAQMRCMVQGLLSPGDPYKAAKLAFIDSQVSHSGNGIYGGIHAAVLTSLAFVFNDPKKIIKESLQYIPQNTEFSRIVSDVIKYCQETSDWLNVLRKVEENFKTYNWIHLYPNTASVITSLWFGEGDFDKSMKIVSSFGYDVDCNAGEIGTILGVIYGQQNFPNYWSIPLNNNLETYLPFFQKIKISDLADWTYELVGII
jgi:ADP-ribosylglycohydrolase